MLEKILAGGGVAAALAASTCRVLPLSLTAVGVSPAPVLRAASIPSKSRSRVGGASGAAPSSGAHAARSRSRAAGRLVMGPA